MAEYAKTSLAAVFTAVGEPLALREFPLPELRGSEILVRVRCTTICGSDLHSYFGRRHSPVPSVLGHEMVGEIADAGPRGALDFRGSPLKIGDRVTWSMCGVRPMLLLPAWPATQMRTSFQIRTRADDHRAVFDWGHRRILLAA